MKEMEILHLPVRFTQTEFPLPRACVIESQLLRGFVREPEFLPFPSLIPQRLSYRDVALTTLPVRHSIVTRHSSYHEHDKGRCSSARASVQLKSTFWLQRPTALFRGLSRLLTAS